MSRTWSSCAVEQKCGGPCGTRITFGEPMLTITSHPAHSLKAKFVRCRKCAGEPAPTNLPPPVVNRGPAIEPHLLERRGQKALPLDFKAAAAGREPGSDD